MLGGFTYKGIHSSAYGIRCQIDTNSNAFGVSNATVQSIGGTGYYSGYRSNEYDYRAPKSISLTCSFLKEDMPDIPVRQRMRQAIGWLTGKGVLSFDIDPGIFYNVYALNSNENLILEEGAAITIEFQLLDSYGYSEAKQLDFTSVTTIDYPGTLPTEPKIYITNSKSINSFVINIKRST